MAEEDEVSRAISIAREAGQELLGYFGSDRVEARHKGERDVVTAADLASENLIRERLVAAFPADGLRGEEGARREPISGRCWYVDPLDGTFNFSRGIPVWCVNLSLFQGDEPVLGITHDPLLDETFAAQARGVSTLNGTTLQTRQVRGLADAVVHITVDFDNPAMKAGLHDLMSVSPRVLKTRNLGSAALALAYVAAGRLDAFLHRSAHTWDFGAGALLVRAAGGAISEIDGSPYSVDSTSVLAAGTAELHADLLDLVGESGTRRLE